MADGPGDAVPVDAPESWDAVVLGAGITGLVAADVLVEKGASRVLVVDSYQHVGGNHLDTTIGPYTFDIGSLIFQDDSPLVERFPEVLPGYVPAEPSWARITPQGVVAAYPFDFREDVVAAGPWQWLAITASALRARMSRRPLRTAEDFAHRWIGPRMVERSGLGTYMARFCGSPASSVDIEFARSRMLWIAEKASLRSIAQQITSRARRNRPTGPGNAQLVRPPEGFAVLYAPVVERLSGSGVEFALGHAPEAVRRSAGGFEVQVDGRVHRAAQVFSTIPIDHALALCGLPAEVPLPTVTLVSLYFSFAGERGFEASVLYNFAHTGHWKRLTVHSDFYGRRAAREFFTVEVVVPPGGLSEAEAEADFRSEVEAVGLFVGDLVLEGAGRLEHAYPIFTVGSGDRSRRSRERLRGFGVLSFGRQGGFEYQPTARVSTQHAERALADVMVPQRADGVHA